MSDEKLINELNVIKGATPPDSKWLKEPFVGLIKIVDIKISEKEKKKDGTLYTGLPYFKFMILTKTREQSSIIFWREVEGADAKKNEDKRNKLKKFLDNAGADTTKTGLDYLNSVIGKKLKAVLKTQDEFSTSSTGVPQVLKKITYSYSCKETEELEGVNISQLHIPLSEKDQAAYNSAIAVYEQAMGAAPAHQDTIAGDNANPGEEKDEDFPA